MKILYDYETLILQKYGGVSRYHYQLASLLNLENEVHVPVIFSRNFYFQNFLKRPACNYNNRYLSYFLRKLNAVITFFVLSIAYFSGKPYDIVHSTFYNPDYIYPYYRWIDKKHRTKYVITVYDMIQEIEAPYRPNMARSARAKKKALKVADGIISISEKTKEDLASLYTFIDPDKIQTIYLSSDKINDNINHQKPEKLPERYVLFVGVRHVERKNFIRVVDAMSQIHTLFPDLYLVCTGGGKLTDQEMAHIKSAGLEGSVCQGFFDDNELPAVYAHAECFIYPSLYEGFGLPILEAWAMNCPVLLSDASCFPEIGGDAALYFNGESVDEITAALKQVLGSESLRDELRAKGKSRLGNFSWEKMAKETAEYYKKIMA